MDSLFVSYLQRTNSPSREMVCLVLLCLKFLLILQGDVGLPGPAGPPPSTGELEFMGFPKGKKGSKVVNI